MADFAPTLGGGIGFEQPVQSPSFINTVGALTSTFLSTQGPAPAPKEASDSERLNAAKRKFWQELQRGTAIKEQGHERQGTRIIHSAGRAFFRDYGTEHEDISSAFEDATGFATQREVTGSYLDESAITDSPRFNTRLAALQQQFPDVDPEAIFQSAREQEIRRQANDLRIEEHTSTEGVNWLDIEEDYIQRARLFGEDLSTMVGLIEKDQIVTPEEAQTLRGYLKDNLGAITKPRDVSDTDWNSYMTQYVEPLTELGDTLIHITQNTGPDGDQVRFLQQIVNKAARQGKLPAMLAATMNGMRANESGAISEVLRLLATNQGANERLQTAYRNLTTFSNEELLDWVTSFEERTDLGPFDNFNQPDYNNDMREWIQGTSSTEKLDQIKAMSRFTGLSDPQNLGVKTTHLLTMHKMLASLSGDSLSPESMQGIFTPSYFRALDEIKQANPVVGEQITQRAYESLVSLQQSTGRTLDSILAEKGFVVETGSSGLPVVVPEFTDLEKRMLEEHFPHSEGLMASWMQAVNQNGVTGPSGVLPNVGISLLRSKINDYREIGNHLDRMRAVKRMSDTWAEEAGLLQGGDGTDALEGGSDRAALPSKSDVQLRRALPDDVANDTRFLSEVRRVSSKHNIPESWLMRWMEGESGFNPKAVNPSQSKATGIIQFVGTTMERLGVTREQVLSMDRAEQMALVDKYLEGTVGGRELRDYGDLFMAGLFPAYLGKPDDTVMWEKDGKYARAYRENSTLDKDGSGTVTVGEARRFAMGKGGGVSIDLSNIPVAEGVGEPYSPSEERTSTAEPVSVSVQAAQPAAPQGATQPAPAASGSGGGTAKGEDPEVRRARSERVWGTIADETKEMLIRLFGNEEEAKRVIEERGVE